MADDDDDMALFRKAMEDTGVVRQNYQPNRVSNHSVKPVSEKSIPRDIARDAQINAEKTFGSYPLPVPIKAAIDETDGINTVRFAREGVDRRRWKQLKRGQLTIEQSLDLHGMRSAEASRALSEFLAESADYGLLCIEVIHGKGLRSDQPGGILKPLTLHFLKQQPSVLAFCSAPPNQGGSGATIILLSRSR